jgi:excisionase family DNA binding protein
MAPLMRPPDATSRPAQVAPDGQHPARPESLPLSEWLRLLGISDDDLARMSGMELARALEGGVPSSSHTPIEADSSYTSRGVDVTRAVTPLGQARQETSDKYQFPAKNRARERSTGRGRAGRMLSTRAAAEELGVSVDTVYELIGQGRLRHLVVGPRCFRIDRRWVEAFIEQESRGGQGGRG